MPESWQRLLRRGWIEGFAPVVLLAWIWVWVGLLFQRHQAFHTATFDHGFFTQVVWNTAHGHWYANSLKPPSYLADHFSPTLVFAAPLFWVFPDARALLLAKVIALSVSLLPAYAILRKRYPLLAPLMALCFVLNPLVYKTVADRGDFHDIVFAAPTLALAFYALHRERKFLLWEALALTLLVREDMGLYVGAFGLYVLIFKPRWRWSGVGLIALAVAWTALVLQVLVPAAGYTYRYVPSFAAQSGPLGALLAGRLPDFASLLALFFTPAKLANLWQIFAPLALLPLLAQGTQLLWLPAALFLLAMPTSPVGALNNWYLAALLPLWWGSLGALLSRLAPRRAQMGIAALLGATLLGGVAWGPFSAENRFDPSLYQVTAHDRVGHQFLKRIPPAAAVLAQTGLGPHLATREDLRMYPWPTEPIHYPLYVVLDSKSQDIYPYHTPDDFARDLAQLRLNPAYQLWDEQDGYLTFLLEQTPTLPRQGPWLWAPYLQLEGYALAQTDEAGEFRPAPFTRLGGRTLRVELYWTALAALPTDYTVSVALQAPDGFIHAQHDAPPGQGALSSADWKPGRTIRDIHYLDLPQYELPAPLSLVIVVYETYTQKRLAPENGITLTADLAQP